MFNLEWLHPAYAGLAAIALLLVLPAFFWARHQRRRLARFLPAAGSDASPRRRFWRDLSLLAAVILLGVCLAMPFAGRDQVVETGSSRSLVFVLDASKSMNCRDCREVSRLDYARSWIRELLQGFPGDHVGLVSFAGAASSDCPLTADHKSLFDAAAALEPGLLPAGSDLGAGLREAQRQFPDETAGSRVIILLSDGEELGGDSKSELDKLKQTGIPVIAVALGRSDRNSPVLESDGKPLKRKNGEAVTSRPDYRAMEAIAVASGGLFVPFQPEEPMSGGLLMAGERIKQVSQVQAEEQARSRPRLIYQLILPLVLLVLLIRLCVGERAKSAATSLLILLLPLRLPAEELATPAQALDLHRRVSEALGAGQDVRAEQTKIEEALKIPGLPKALSAALARDLATIRHATSLAKMEFDPGGAVTDATAAIDAYGQALKTEPGSADLIKGLRSAHAARQQALELKRLRDEQKAQEEKKRQQERQKQARQAADNARQAKEEQDKANRERLEERESQSSAPRGEAGEEKAGEEKAGEEKAGEEKAGEEKA
ncbi:MAG: hypothetical protein RL095_3402, partial [Verrucomicrobiota bacterium]